MDTVRQIRAFNAGRDPERLALKYHAMRKSSFAFLRGTCHLFYARLAKKAGLQSAPWVWVCGDLHLENFGSYKGDNRLTYFDLNDFDEAALAPATRDLVRVLTSLRIAAGEMAFTEETGTALCRHFVQSYATALVSGKAYWLERETAQGRVRVLLERLRERERSVFLDARTTLHKGQRTFKVDGKKALPASAAQRALVLDFMSGFAATQSDPDFFTALDVVRRIAGTGSLGVDRYAVLVQGKGSPHGNHVLDLKQALPSSLVPHLKTPQQRWRSEAHRIVAVQQRMQAVPMAFLQPVFFNDRPYVLRALQPVEDKLDFSAPPRSRRELDHVIADLGRLLAWAQLRSTGRDGSASTDELIAFGQRRKWKEQLLSISHACAAQVARDAAEFNEAYDEGALHA